MLFNNFKLSNNLILRDIKKIKVNLNLRISAKVNVIDLQFIESGREILH